MSSSENIITRRAVLTSAALIPVAAIHGLAQNGATQTKPATLLDAAQRRALTAIVDRLIPKDELSPSASECGVVEYINAALGDYNAPEKPAFLEGLSALDQHALGMHGTAFAELTADRQDAILNALNANQVPALRPFFNRVWRFTLEGMFGDPSYGGNRNYAGWDLLRYPGAKYSAAVEDQKMSTALVLYRKPIYAGPPNSAHDHGK